MHNASVFNMSYAEMEESTDYLRQTESCCMYGETTIILRFSMSIFRHEIL